jgi:hypothetical protein
MTSMWTDMTPAADASCQHCARGIWRRPWGWEDGDGVTVCIKAPLENIGLGIRPDYVGHQPMPAGLRGAPLGLRDRPPVPGEP